MKRGVTEQSQRQRRVGMIIHRALSLILLNEGYKVIINEVLLTKDLRLAHVYILPHARTGAGGRAGTGGTLQTEFSAADKEMLRKLKAHVGRIKQKLNTHLHLKYMPDLRFHLDAHFIEVQKLNELLS